jgi:hypothetical protein
VLEQLQSLFSTFRSRIIAAVCLAILVVVSLCLFLWTKSNNNPEQIFWSAINNSLSTSSVIIEAGQSSEGTTQEQLSQLTFGQHPIARTLTILTSGNSVVRTEDLSTPSSEFTRYDSINTTKKNKNGTPVNFSSVLGVWAKTTPTQATTPVVPPVYGQILLGLSLPFGDLTASEKVQLIEELQTGQVYDTAFPAAKKVTVDGRLAYEYNVTIQPILYIRYMKEYAADMGLHQLDQVNPNTYEGQSAFNVTWTVDVNSREIVRAVYGNNNVENYGGYGLPVTVSTPTKAITTAALQSRLTSLLSK